MLQSLIIPQVSRNEGESRHAWIERATEITISLNNLNPTAAERSLIQAEINFLYPD